MTFLIRKRGAMVKAHIWLGRDTACRLYSTGGMKQSRFALRQERGGHEICHMCAVKQGLFVPASLCGVAS